MRQLLLSGIAIALLSACDAGGGDPNPDEHGGTGPGGPYDIIGPATPTPAPPAPSPSPTPEPTPTPLPDFGCGGPIVEGNATAEASTSTECLSCTVDGVENVVDLDPESFASMNLTTAVAGASATIAVTAQEGVVYPSGNVAGAVLSIPGATAQSQVMPSIDIVTTLGGAEQERQTYSGTIVGEIAGQFGDPSRFFLGYETTQQFDGVSVVVDPDGASLGSAVNDYVHCGDADAASTELPTPIR